MANEPYRLSAPWTSKPGSYDLIFTVTKDGNADVLPATLTIPPDDPGGKAGTASPCRTSQAEFGELSSGTVPMTLIAGARRLCCGNCRHDACCGGGSRPAMILILAGMLVMFIGAARAHDGEDHGAPADSDSGGARPGAAAARRRRVRAQEHAAHSRHPHRPDRIGRASHRARIAGPHHSRSERQRICPVVGRRPTFAAAGRFSAAGDAGQERRCARLCDAAAAGHRRFRHAPAPRRTRPADFHRGAPAGPLRNPGAERRRCAHPARGYAAGAAGPEGPARLARPGRAANRKN